MMEIEKEIDRLGRVVIPMEFRKKLDIKANSKLLISLSDGEIIIRAQNRQCSICGKKLEDSRELPLCNDCINKVKEL